MPFPSSGGALWRGGRASIRFAFHGCANRPFYHIVIQNVSGCVYKYKIQLLILMVGVLE